MSAHVLPTIPKRPVDFATLATGTTSDLVLADRVPLVQWRELTLRATVYSHSLAGSSNTIAIMVFPASWTAEEPGLQFIDQTNSWSVTLDNSTPLSAFFQLTIPTTGTACIGHMARIVARGTRNGAGALNATISLEFSTKDA